MVLGRKRPRAIISRGWNSPRSDSRRGPPRPGPINLRFTQPTSPRIYRVRESIGIESRQLGAHRKRVGIINRAVNRRENNSTASRRFFHPAINLLSVFNFSPSREKRSFRFDTGKTYSNSNRREKGRGRA